MELGVRLQDGQMGRFFVVYWRVSSRYKQQTLHILGMNRLFYETQGVAAGDIQPQLFVARGEMWRGS